MRRLERLLRRIRLLVKHVRKPRRQLEPPAC